MKLISISQLKNKTDFWLKQVQKETIVITRYKKPIAIIMSFERYEKSKKTLEILTSMN